MRLKSLMVSVVGLAVTSLLVSNVGIAQAATPTPIAAPVPIVLLDPISKLVQVKAAVTPAGVRKTKPYLLQRTDSKGRLHNVTTCPGACTILMPKRGSMYTLRAFGNQGQVSPAQLYFSITPVDHNSNEGGIIDLFMTRSTVFPMLQAMAKYDKRLAGGCTVDQVIKTGFKQLEKQSRKYAVRAKGKNLFADATAAITFLMNLTTRGLGNRCTQIAQFDKLMLASMTRTLHKNSVGVVRVSSIWNGSILPTCSTFFVDRLTGKSTQVTVRNWQEDLCRGFVRDQIWD